VNATASENRPGGQPVRYVGDLVAHPAALVLLVVLVVNDHWAKDAFRNTATGKISDFAGLALFPLVVIALIEAVRRLVIGRTWPLATTWLAAVCIVTGGLFALVKLWVPAGAMYRGVYAVAQWPLGIPGSLMAGRGLPGLGAIDLVQDPTDLIALPAILIAWWVGRRIMARPCAAAERSHAPA